MIKKILLCIAFAGPLSSCGVQDNSELINKIAIMIGEELRRSGNLTSKSSQLSNNHDSTINRYLEAATRLQRSIRLHIHNTLDDLGPFLPILMTTSVIVILFSVIAALGTILSMLSINARAATDRYYYLYTTYNIIVRSLPELLCAMGQFTELAPVSELVKFNIGWSINVTPQAIILFKLFSNISCIILCNRFIQETVKNMLNPNEVLNTATQAISAILHIKMLKMCLIDLMVVTHYSSMDILKYDVNHMETLATVLVIILALLRIRHFGNLRVIRFAYVLRYLSIPLMCMAIIAYASNSPGAQFIYKLLLTILVWPILYQLYILVKAAGYWYIKRLPSYAIRYPIQIFLIISNTLRYSVIPASIILIMYIFDINFLQEIRLFIGSAVYIKIIMTTVLLIFVRIAFILNVYLCTLYAQITANNRPFDKQRIITSSIIIQNLSATLIGIITVLILLSVFGFDISPLFQTLGLFSAAMSLSLQQVIRDIVNGIFILYENSIRIGDWVDYENKTAVVEDMSLRYMRVRLDDGLLITIPFHKLDIIKNKSRQYSYIILNTSIDRKMDLNIAEKAINEAFENIREKAEFKYKILKDIEMRDLADVTAFSYVIQCRICIQPNSQYKVRRAFNRELKVVFDKYKIVIATPLVANATNVPSLNTSEPYPDFQ